VTSLSFPARHSYEAGILENPKVIDHGRCGSRGAGGISRVCSLIGNFTVGCVRWGGPAANPGPSASATATGAQRGRDPLRVTPEGTTSQGITKGTMRQTRGWDLRVGSPAHPCSPPLAWGGLETPKGPCGTTGSRPRSGCPPAPACAIHAPAGRDARRLLRTVHQR